MPLLPGLAIGDDRDRPIQSREVVAEEVLGDLQQLRLIGVSLDHQCFDLGFAVQLDRPAPVRTRDQDVGLGTLLVVGDETDRDRVNEPVLDDRRLDCQRVGKRASGRRGERNCRRDGSSKYD